VKTTTRFRHRMTIAVIMTTGAVAVAAAVIIPLSVSGSSSHPTGYPVAADEPGLHVMPFPGTPAASPQSQIVFSSLRPRQIRSVAVTGSNSGTHTGRLVALPLHRGTAYVPSSPFSAGEQVTVQARLTGPAAGTASGAPNATTLKFGFAVASPANGDVGVTSATPNPSNKPAPGQIFHSQPALHPPVVNASADPDRGAGEMFVTPNNGQQAGPMILSAQGKIVWFRPVSQNDEATDLAVQRYHGQPVLTWWQGQVVAGRGEGTDMILDRSYRTVAEVHAGEGYDTDLHEFKITPEGTALVTSFNAVKANLTSVGGSAHGSVFDCIVQEVDIATGQVLWEWHALGHVPISDSYMGTPPSGAPYDYFHVNSIQQLRNGNLLITARNTWGVYEIDRATGRIVWQLGGKSSSYKLAPGAQFSWEHDAELQPNGTVSVFDDADSPKEEKESRAIVLKLDRRTMTASLLRSYTHNPSVLSGSQGNMQVLPDGAVFVGWGADPDFSEYSSGGRQIFNAAFSSKGKSGSAYPVNTFRAYRFRWSAQPAQLPTIAVTGGKGGHLTVYASWNGATDVASWRLLAGPSPGALSALSTTRSAGFETAISTTTSAAYVAVQAMSSAGLPLTTSAAAAR
jgi:hypothetical protein